MSKGDNAKILVVDDEVDIQEIIKDLFEVFGFDVSTASSGNEAQEILKNHEFDVIISDIRMPNGSGIDLINWVREKDFSQPKFFFITGYSDHTVPEVLDLGAEGLFAKPFEAAEMRSNIKKAFLSRKERWSKVSSVESDKNLQLKFPSVEKAKNDQELSFGRGGFFVKADPKEFAIGDVVSFEFDFSENQPLAKLDGVVEVVWLRPQGNSNNLQQGIGCEIKSVSNETINEFIDWLEKNPVKPYIPIS